MNRKTFSFRQKVKATELNAAFEDVDGALRAFVRSFAYVGIAQGALVSENSPPNLSIVVSGPGLIYDQNQKHIEWFPNQTVNCTLDEVGVATAPLTTGFEKWLSVFAQYDEVLSDPRVDGNGVTVYFARTESFKLNVLQGAEAAAGTALRPPLRADQILLADVKLVQGQTQILNADISTTRTQVIYVMTGSPNSLRKRNLPDALQGMVDILNSFTASTIAVPAVSDSPLSTIAGSVTNVFTQLLGFINGITPTSLTVNAIAGSPNSTVSGSITAVLTQLLGFINSNSLIAAITDSPLSTLAGSVPAVLTQLLGFINDNLAHKSIANIFTATQRATGAGSSSADGLYGIGGSPNGVGVHGKGDGTGNGVYGKGGDSNGIGVHGDGDGSAPGVFGEGGSSNGEGVRGEGGGSSGRGVHGIGGSSGGEGGYFEGQSGADSNAIFGQGTGDGAGIRAQGGPDDGPAGLFIANASGDGTGVDAACSGSGPALKGTAVGTGEGALIASASGYGVHATGGTDKPGVYGKGGPTGIGVEGEGIGVGSGVYGHSSNGIGVDGDGGAGSKAGVRGSGGSPNGIGVEGVGSGSGPGVRGFGSSVGVKGESSTIAVRGVATGSGAGVRGDAVNGDAVYAESSNGNGVRAKSGGNGIGVFATGAGDGAAVYAEAGNEAAIVAYGGSVVINAPSSPRAALQLKAQTMISSGDLENGDLWFDGIVLRLRTSSGTFILQMTLDSP